MSKQKKVVIIGAGFGGIEMAKAFKNQPVDVLLIDKNNYHNFQPLMYQVATGGLEPGSIAYPVRRIFRKQNNLRFRLAEVISINTDQNSIDSSIGKIDYDYLVIATGSQNNFFNFEPVKEKLLTLKSINDSLHLRNVVIKNLEKALAEYRREPRAEIMNIAIVGGGPAGLELAGALAEMKRYVLPRDFPELEIEKMQINLYEAAPRLLASMSQESSRKSLEFVQDLGVNVFLDTKVTSYDGREMTLEDGSSFLTDTVVWTAGVKGAPVHGLEPDTIVTGNRISVDRFNKVKDLENVYAIGDVASHMSENNEKGLPMLAPVAQQQGKFLAKNIIRKINGEAPLPFVYRDKGSMATIGRNKAVVDLPSKSFQGVFAWFVWMFVHIMSLVGFRNKLVALIDWTSNYLNYDRPLGLIIDKEKDSLPSD
jgi:NADH dehydrogenase